MVKRGKYPRLPHHFFFEKPLDFRWLRVFRGMSLSFVDPRRFRKVTWLEENDISSDDAKLPCQQRFKKPHVGLENNFNFFLMQEFCFEKQLNTHGRACGNMLMALVQYCAYYRLKQKTKSSFPQTAKTHPSNTQTNALQN